MAKTGRFEPVLLALCLVGCASRPTPDVDAFAQHSADNSFEVFDRSFASNGLVLPVVHDRQDSAASCGAHVLASVINYWQGAGAVTGDGIYLREPPADPHGYTLAELQALAIRHGLIASAVRIDKRAIIRELENGRPVLIPVQLPAVYVEPRALPGTNVPVMGIAAGALVNRMGRVLQFSHMGLVNHYLLVVGYDAHRFAVVEPVMGYRTISFERLARFRRPFADAALVLSGRHAPAASAAAPAAN